MLVTGTNSKIDNFILNSNRTKKYKKIQDFVAHNLMKAVVDCDAPKACIKKINISSETTKYTKHFFKQVL